MGYADDLGFLYREGVWTYLNALIDPLSGWVLTSGNGINDSGQITGRGLLNGQERAFLMTPVPEPSSIALAAIALVGLATLRWHRPRAPS